MNFTTIKHQLDLYRRYRYWYKEKCIYIHIPKAAGTSINKALYGKTLGHYRADEITCKFPRLYKKSFVFSMVRNPWSRSLSAYKFAKIGRTETMGMKNPEQYQVPQFDNFERFVLEWLPQQDLRQSDFVFQPQYIYLYDQNLQLMVDSVGKVESIDQDIKVVEYEMQRSLPIKRINSTSDNDDYRNAYTTEMRDMIAKLYRTDIELFKYEF
jgi:hypothetical protein